MATPNIPAGSPNTRPEARQPTRGARLIPIDFSSDYDRDTLTKQRVICGWNTDKVPTWAKIQARGDRTMFWIAVPESGVAKPSQDASDNEAILKLSVDEVTRRTQATVHDRSSMQDKANAASKVEEPYLLVGHVALDKVDLPSHESEGFPPDETIASRANHLLTIAALFVHPAYKSTRLGAFAMDECERMAQQLPYGDPECTAVTVNTLSPRYYPGGMDTERWKVLGQPQPKMDNSLWYARRGYVAFRECVRYLSDAPDGMQLQWYSIYMRKELGEPAVAR